MDGALVSSSLFTSPLHIDQIGNCANTSDFWITEIRCWSCRRSAELLRHHAARSLHLPLTERQLLLYLPCWTRGDDALMPVDPLNRNTALQANGVSPCVLNETPVQQRAPNGLPLVVSQHGVVRFNALPTVGGKWGDKWSPSCRPAAWRWSCRTRRRASSWRARRSWRSPRCTRWVSSQTLTC